MGKSYQKQKQNKKKESETGHRVYSWYEKGETPKQRQNPIYSCGRKNGPFYSKQLRSTIFIFSNFLLFFFCVLKKTKKMFCFWQV